MFHMPPPFTGVCTGGQVLRRFWTECSQWGSDICCGQQVPGNLGHTAVTLGAIEGPLMALMLCVMLVLENLPGELSPGSEPQRLGGRISLFFLQSRWEFLMLKTLCYYARCSKELVIGVFVFLGERH